MSNLQGEERARYVQSMFAQIARRYDLMNRLMTVGQDRIWREEVIRRADLPTHGRLLDLGTGTGDLARQALRDCPGCEVIAADFTLAMMQTGRQAEPGAVDIDWSGADALRLPFPDRRFDAVVSGFLMRNVSDIPRSLREQYRVLKPGGRIVVLDTTPPPNTPLAPFIRIHLHTIIPILGGLVTGNRAAYQYLPESTENFLPPERMALRMIEAGFREVGYQRRMFATVAVHWGVR